MSKRTIGKAGRPVTMAEVKAAPVGRFHLGGGLYLDRRTLGPTTGVWTFKFRLPQQKSREMGLGSVATVSLADARTAAAEARAKVARGLDPIEERRKAQADAALVAASRRTFEQAFEAFLEARGDQLGDTEKARAHWASSVRRYAIPVIGKRAVADVTRDDVVAVLRPIWTSKSETARQTRQRMARVLDYAKARGWRTGDNVAELQGGLADLLGPRDTDTDHHPHLLPRRMPAFMAALAGYSSMSALALRFTILTAARTGETLSATLAEVDLHDRIWRRPAPHMKMRAPHRVPLSDAALSTVAAAYQLATGSPLPTDPDAAAAALRADATLPIFPGRSRKRPLSNMAMAMLLRGMNEVEEGQPLPWLADDGRLVLVHGFRGSFRTWAGETGIPWDVAETCLAHKIGNATSQAYHHGDLLDLRRPVMEAWARWCLPER